MDRERTPDMRFNGNWVGETQGYDSPPHRWEIHQRGGRLTIRTAWEGPGQGPAIAFLGRVVPGEAAFTVGSGFKATLVDPQHFVIPGWDTNDTRGGVGPAYDVVFSRPGLAELTAHAAWRRFLAAQDEG